jgi:hypothetical protein
MCLNTRRYALNHQTAAAVHAGEVGESGFATASYLQDWPLLETDWTRRLVPEGAGALRSLPCDR